MIINAVRTILLVALILGVLFWASSGFFINGGPERTSQRSIIRKLSVKSRDIEGGAFLSVYGVLVFGIPILAYYITLFVYKIRMDSQKKYYSYHAKVSEIDFHGNIHIIGKKEFYQDILDSYKCIGIRKKNTINKNVIVVYTLDKAYVLPDVNKNMLNNN